MEVSPIKPEDSPMPFDEGNFLFKAISQETCEYKYFYHFVKVVGIKPCQNRWYLNLNDYLNE